MDIADVSGMTPKSTLKDRTIRRLLFRSRPKVPQSTQEDQLIQRLREISEETENPLVEQSTDDVPTADIAKGTWALQISGQSTVKQGFTGLMKAVDEYNAHASKGRWHLVEKQGVCLEEIQKLAETKQAVSVLPTDQGAVGQADIKVKIKDGLQQFCRTTLHYGQVMDTLAQHHPEWVSLAWGTVKLFLMIPIEYQKIQESVASNLAQIGSKLQLIGLLMRFFPTDNIVDATSAVYAAIAEFLEVSLRWLGNSWLVRTMKTVAVPFNTRLGPILDKIEENYALLKEQAEMQWMISGFKWQMQAQSEWVSFKKSQDRVLELLEGVIQQDRVRKERQLRAIEGSRSVDRSLFRSPELDVCKEFFLELLPFEQSLQKAQTQMDILPEIQLNEGVNMIHRKAFRAWMQSEISGLLWIDGYQTLHRRSWTTDFAINVIRAASANSFGTLYYFGSLSNNEPQPRSLIQTLEFNLLQRFPSILSQGDPELFSSEIFLAAKPSLDLSWRIFVECLRLVPFPVIYIVVEGIDHVAKSDDFRTLLRQLSHLASPGTVEDKLIKVLVTSVRPDAGFNNLFFQDAVGTSENKRDNTNNVLIRVPSSASRSRKMPLKSPRRKTPSSAEFPPPTPDAISGHSGAQPLGAEDDFLPTDTDDDERGNEEAALKSDSDSDFDIYGSSALTRARSGTIEDEMLASNQGLFSSLTLADKVGISNKDDDDDSDSSFSIFEAPRGPVVSGRRQSSDFAPSDDD
ncbi:hypothetical protein QBC40DRAFT_261326 [Triangularia verruculosa]|uniref:Uncharacterized protein n=1 Tax=Triangularia verruculosa TaxID=2587418 RepID=A0AAN6XSJ1_9PEZI|nr:hypothetical protein QBC40DRAFT_261326 [Triangularia verruculosa]